MFLGNIEREQWHEKKLEASRKIGVCLCLLDLSLYQ